MSVALTGTDAPPGPAPGDPGRRGSTVWVGTSWKMTKTLAQARAWVDGLGSVPAGVTPFVLPPLTALASVRGWLPPGSPVVLGAQNASEAPEGARTGEVSMGMVRDAGAVLVEVGHSERRELLGESDAVVAAKVSAALAASLRPLLCVGEPEAVRGAGREVGFVTDQVRSALGSLAPADLARVLVAYEPVWAIGEHGRAAEPEQLGAVLDAVVAVLDELAGGQPRPPVLYGGSVTATNAGAFLELPDVDGLFVGRAAWTPEGFAALLDVGGTTARRRTPSPSHPGPEQRSS